MTLDNAKEHGRAITAAVEQFVASAVNDEYTPETRSILLREARSTLALRIADALIALKT